MITNDAFAERLAPHEDRLRGFFRKEARGLLRFEGLDDLVQGAFLKMLASRNAPRPESFEGWVFTVARAFIVERHRYWRACRRDGGHLLRITASPASTQGPGGHLPADERTGPASFAERRDDLTLAARAIDSLPDRDRSLIEHLRDGLSVEESAQRLGLSYDAAQKARVRARDRFTQALEILAG